MRSPLALLCFAGLVAITAWGYFAVPSGLDLPVHWGLGGEVTATMPRNWALAQMPIATALIWGVFYLITTRGTATQRPSTAIVLRWGLPVLTALFAVVQLAIVLTGLGVALPFFHAT
ncbi:MAG: hypothetical protein ABI398_13590 [Devosia sp.]